MTKENQTLSCVCDPQGVGNGRTTYPRVFGASHLDLWLRNGHPQGVPTLTDPARWVSAPTDAYRWVPALTDPYRWVPAQTDPARRIPHPAFITIYHRPEDPDRDPRFIATGRAATAAMTCGQISTPCGSHRQYHHGLQSSHLLLRFLSHRFLHEGEGASTSRRGESPYTAIHNRLL